MCEYAYYENNTSKPQIYCKINNKLCLFSKFCTKQNKYIHREGVDDCYMALEEKKKTIPNGSYYVRFVKNGFAYIEINNKVIKVKDTIGNIDNYVYLQQVDGQYQISLTPFFNNNDINKPKKRQYRKKK